ncbi:MAG: hypothetical protein OSJ43_16260 [Oscillospiraceae bacterium]|nr:hypothetical protein [Oscillospiraceae bacterium]
MFRLTKTNDLSVLEIAFDYFEPLHSFDPFHDILSEYAAETGITPIVVDPLFNFKFTEDGHNIQFYWNGCFTIYIFYISKVQYDIVYGRLNNICTRLNKQLGKERYFAKYGKYPHTD